MKQLLPLPHHAKEIVVENKNFYSSTELHNCTKFLQRHLKTTITNDRNNSSVLRSVLCTNRCRQCKTHCAKSATRDVALRFYKRCIATSNHLVLTNISNNHCITFC